MPWKPCTIHNWQPIPDNYGIFRCANSDCLCAGYQPQPINPHFNTSHPGKIKAYHCAVPTCPNPTQEPQKRCPDCRKKKKAQAKERSVEEIQLTDKQLDVIRLFADQEDVPAPGQIVGTLHQLGLVKKRQITVWSLSKKGEALLLRLKKDGLIPPGDSI